MRDFEFTYQLLRKFSQSSTDMLHATIEKLKARQEAITASYESREEAYELTLHTLCRYKKLDPTPSLAIDLQTNEHVQKLERHININIIYRAQSNVLTWL